MPEGIVVNKPDLLCFDGLERYMGF